MIAIGFVILIFALVLMKKGLNKIRFGPSGRAPGATRSAGPRPRMQAPPPGPTGPPPEQRPGYGPDHRYGYDGGGY